MQLGSQSDFSQFRKYCSEAATTLNNQEGYCAQYKISSNPFLREHDGQWLQVTYTGQQQVIKLSLVYSIAYSVPAFYFMVYDMDSTPLTAQQIYKQYLHSSKHNQLHPQQRQGIYLVQHPINKGYYYTLHHCSMNLSINRLVPFYFSLLHLHPPLIIHHESESRQGQL